MGKYAPLYRHLAAQPADIGQLQLTFAQVEQLVGTLPQASRSSLGWWAATLAADQGTQPQKAARWRVVSLDPAAQVVALTRDAAPDIPAPGHSSRSPSRHEFAAGIAAAAVTAAASGATAIVGLAHLPLIATVLMSMTAAAIAFTITQAIGSRQDAPAAQQWWAVSTVLALLLSLGAFTYHRFLDPAARAIAQPFTASVLVNPSPAIKQGCRTIVLPGPWRHYPTPGEPLTDANVSRWQTAQHGIDGGSTTVVIKLQGRSEQAVTISQPLVYVHRSPPVRGATAELSGGCGGGLQPRVFAVNLDLPSPTATLVAGQPYPPQQSGGTRWTQAATPSFTISASNPEFFVIVATTKTATCRWWVKLSWQSLSRTGTLTIGDNGRPFETTANSAQPWHHLNLGAWH